VTRRVGAVDLGTNSTRLLVADVGDGSLVEVDRLLTITRMGDAVDATGRLSDEALARVHAALARYAARAHELDAAPVLAVATSAARDAANGRELLAGLGPRYGFATRLASGDEEARLTAQGVALGRSLAPGTLICDIGGGSTELTLTGEGDAIALAVSLDIGCVRLQERHLRSDPPTDAELAALRRAVAGALPALPGEVAELVGVAGTVTTLAAIDLSLDREIPALVDGHRLARAAVERELARLAALPLARRRRVHGLMPERAPTIVAGAAILAEVMRHAGAGAATVSERDILHGIALEAAAPAAGAAA
jgi:exopolyphosphatase/guanosine-5'-triphosphate,3'-diphosphate pyrophosphatase